MARRPTPAQKYRYDVAMSAAHAKGDVNLQSRLNERSPPPLPKELKWYEDEHMELKRTSLGTRPTGVCLQNTSNCDQFSAEAASRVGGTEAMDVNERSCKACDKVFPKRYDYGVHYRDKHQTHCQRCEFDNTWWHGNPRADYRMNEKIRTSRQEVEKSLRFQNKPINGSDKSVASAFVLRFRRGSVRNTTMREVADYKCAICKACITDGDVDGWCYMLRASNKCPPRHGYCVRCRPASVRKPNGKSVCYCPGTGCNVLYVMETARLDPVPEKIWKEAQLLQNEAYDQRKQERDALHKEEREKKIWQRGGVKKCRICEKVFESRYMKETHLRKAHRIGVLKCEYCGKENTSNVALKTHSKRGCATMRKRQRVDQCGKTAMFYLYKKRNGYNEILYLNGGNNALLS
ncbi:unnamed protein product [Orchesella dallaii]|uniref:C2H2-type domain-containing protein n=1 Tax=Orchesella dallaii TaxID=48710 RepID=A0ABP1PHB3_9HEXA